MAMYALAIAPLMKKCANESTQIWYVDDAAAGGSIYAISSWWKKLVENGPQFGYFPKASKPSVIVKPGFEAITHGFLETLILLHLGVPLGSPD